MTDAYCGNNPISFIDPFGLAQVGLRAYAEDFGASVSWNGSTGYATVNYNGISGSYKGTIDKNGRMQIDDSILNSKFGWGTTITMVLGSVKLTNVPNNQIRSIDNSWSYRYEPGNPNNPGDNSHMHVFSNDGKQSYSQHDDGSPKDGPKGGSGPSSKVMKKLNEKTGWDWKSKQDDFINKTKIQANESGGWDITYPNGNNAYITPMFQYMTEPYPSQGSLINLYFNSQNAPASLNPSLFLPLPNPVPIPITAPAPMPVPILGW